MNKKTLFLFFTVSFLAWNSKAAIQLAWAHTDEELYNSDSVTLLEGSENDPSIGFFMQLLKGTPANIDLSEPDAVGVGNELVDSQWVGVGRFEALSGGSVDGEFDYENDYSNLNTGDEVFVRFWNAPSPNFASGFAPTPLNGGTATHYGDSASYIINDGGTGIDTFNVTSTSTTTVIPEPSTFFLMTVFAAAGLIQYRTRRRKKQL